METKKVSSASLENKTHDFLLMGLVVALGFLYIIFEWSTTDVKKYIPPTDMDQFIPEEIVLPSTKQLTPPPPAVAAPPKIMLPTNISTVNNNVATPDVDFVAPDVDEPVEPIVTPIEEPIDEPDFFIVAEKAPSFPGGQKAMMDYLRDHIKYPAALREAGIQGRVIVSFVVDTDGSIKDITVLRSAHERLDAEAIRVVSSMPNWDPGENQGRKVRVRYQLPVFFRTLN